MRNSAGAFALVALLCSFASTADETVIGGLTPIGAQAGGSKDGKIPAWTGGVTVPPSGYRAGGKFVDPFADDKPAFVITAANYSEYTSRLSLGHQALFARYPDFRIPVYPTRRSVSFPQPIYAAAASNRSRAALKGIDAIEGAKLAIPFPSPRSGVEIVWNHRLRYHADSADWFYHQAVVYADGAVDMNHGEDRILYSYANTSQPIASPNGGMYSYNYQFLAHCGDAPRAGALWHDPINAVEKARDFWMVTQGRTYRLGYLTHDRSSACSDGLRYFDQLDMFNGSFDRYTFRLIGKREMYVPYNSYRLIDGHYTNAQLLRRGHLNPDAPRYELHRVWMVEATLRPGEHHSISKRVFYVDEDSWSILLIDCYDTFGKLWRFQEGHLLPLYSTHGVDYAPLVTYDFKDGRYFADRLLSESRPPQFNIPMRPEEFSPNSVAVNFGDRKS